jgi:hypothetical protein
MALEVKKLSGMCEMLAFCSGEKITDPLSSQEFNVNYVRVTYNRLESSYWVTTEVIVTGEYYDERLHDYIGGSARWVESTEPAMPLWLKMFVSDNCPVSRS